MTAEESQFEHLVDAYFLGELNSSEVQELERIVRSSPENALYFIEASRDDWIIGEQLRSQQSIISEFPIAKQQSPFRLARFVGIAATLALAGFVLGALLMNTPKTQIATVTELSAKEAEITASTESSGWRSRFAPPVSRELQVGSAIYQGEIVRVPEYGKLVYTYLEDATSVKISELSSFTLSAVKGAKMVQLHEGRMLADVSKQPVGRPMRIDTPDAKAIIQGTTFELTVGEITKLAVETGLVSFLPDHVTDTIDVGAGEKANTSSRLNHREGEIVFIPIEEYTRGRGPHTYQHMAINAKRGYSALLMFDIDVDLEAVEFVELRTRAVRHMHDKGGSGHIQLLRVRRDTRWNTDELLGAEVLAQFQGKVTDGDDLNFVIPTSVLTQGTNAFVIQFKKNGDDFRISSSGGVCAPKLVFKLSESLKHSSK